MSLSSKGFIAAPSKPKGPKEEGKEEAAEEGDGAGNFWGAVACVEVDRAINIAAAAAAEVVEEGFAGAEAEEAEEEVEEEEEVAVAAV